MNEAVRKDGVPGVDRMWDSQWVNVVNAPEVLEALRDYRAEDAVNIAVKLTEETMAANHAKASAESGKQRAALLEALVGLYGRCVAELVDPEDVQEMYVAQKAIALAQGDAA